MTNFSTVNLVDNGIHIDIEGTTVGTIDIPSSYVPHTFAPILGMHLLLTGEKLKNGMLVVLEDNHARANPNQLSPEYPDRKNGFVPSEYDRARVEETARWALVTDLKLLSNGPDSQLVKFTAIYADGTMRDRAYDTSYKWAVLKEFNMRPACPNCGSVHEGEPDGSPSPLFGSVIGRIAEEFLADVLKSFEEDEDAHPDHEARQPGESEEEYLERRRDEEEKRGEYERNEAFAYIRSFLSGRPRQ